LIGFNLDFEFDDSLKINSIGNELPYENIYLFLVLYYCYLSNRRLIFLIISDE